MELHPNEISLVDFDFQVLIVCGRNAAVVNMAAANPNRVMESISCWIFVVFINV